MAFIHYISLIFSLASVCLLAIWICFRRSKYLSPRNKAVLITGCDSGFGHLLARRLSELGYKVFAGCLFEEGEGAERLKHFSPSIVVLQLDVTKESDVKCMRQRISEDQGDAELWAVVNNAAIMQLGNFELCSVDTFRKVLEVNTLGMVRVTMEVLPLLKKSKGRIVNVTSMGGNTGIVTGGCVAYAMSKAAAKKFSDVIRLELKTSNVLVIDISPYCYSAGFSEEEKIRHTVMECWDQADPDVKASLTERYPEQLINATKHGFRILGNTRLGEVIDCMVDAICLESPRQLYTPGNLINRIVFSLPSWWLYYAMDHYLLGASE